MRDREEGRDGREEREGGREGGREGKGREGGKGRGGREGGREIVTIDDLPTSLGEFWNSSTYRIDPEIHSLMEISLVGKKV